MESEDIRELRATLLKLKQEHRDLDSAIDALEESGRADQLQLKRLKKKKLFLKEEADWHPVDDEAQDAAKRYRVHKEHRPDHRDTPPGRCERGDDAEGGHAEIVAHDRAEHLRLVPPSTAIVMVL